jgi:endo-1,4-beta-xylanase
MKKNFIALASEGLLKRRILSKKEFIDKTFFLTFALILFSILPAAVNSLAQEKLFLKKAFKNDFLIGTAINERQFSGKDSIGISIIKPQFNSISPENVLKWQSVHPKPDSFNFGPSDLYVEFGERNKMFIIGHTLVWQFQTPRWVFEDENGKPVDRETLLERMHNHIKTVVGRYKGRIEGWDVVNEALNEDGSLKQTPWMKIIGEDYIEKAFEYAHEADPDAELYYNDYSLENKPKRDGAVKLIKKLKSEGIFISGIGDQMHAKMDWPEPLQVDSMLVDFDNIGIRVSITELDISVLPYKNINRSANISLNYEMNAELNPYKNGLPDSVEVELANRYAGLFKVLVQHKDLVERVTFWGVRDSDSWLNFWPVRGRTDYPLLFDRQGEPKLAFYKVIKTAGAN